MKAVVDVERAVEPMTNETSRCCDVGASPQTLRRGMQMFGARIRVMKKKKSSMGQIEQKIELESKPLLRKAFRDVVQSQVDSCPPVCPVCGQ
jgi:hypothetical protein